MTVGYLKNKLAQEDDASEVVIIVRGKDFLLGIPDEKGKLSDWYPIKGVTE